MAPAQIVPLWMQRLQTGRGGIPSASEYNIVMALRFAPEWQGVFAFDDFHHRFMALRPPPGTVNGHDDYPRPISDSDEAQVLFWMQEHDIRVKIGMVQNSLKVTLYDNRFHPLQDYLTAQKWDGKSRIDKWLTYYLGVEEIDNYTGPVGKCWLISAVARAFEPGCMAKYVLILEGEQDLKKSMALSILGGDFFSDDLDEMGSKDSRMQVRNAWIIELAELDSMQRSRVSATKAFISRPKDNFREPYGRHIIEYKRQCVLAGTVNPISSYILDLSGAVRFWPVECTKIDEEALEADRDQLWAEAVHCYQQGEKWHLVDEDQIAQARRVQEERVVDEDPWLDKLQDWLRTDRNYKAAEVTTAEILDKCFLVDRRDIKRVDSTRIGILLRQAGWVVAPGTHVKPRKYCKKDDYLALRKIRWVTPKEP